MNEKSQLLRVRFGANPTSTELKQTGAWDRLLCDHCDNAVIGRYEGYFARTWRTVLPDRPQVEMLELGGLDYQLFKLFHLSVLFKAGVSNRCEFDMVKLGPHTEKLRKMILSGDAGSARVYPIFGVLLTGDDGSVYNQAISPPVLRRFEGHHYYTFIYCGAEWYFRISSHANSPLDGLAIQPNGALRMLVQRWSESELIRNAAVRMFGGGRAPRGRQP